jgi:hypothetical protein
VPWLNAIAAGWNGQLHAVLKGTPDMRARLFALLGPCGWLLRFPVALLLIAGGFLAILPVFGLWMIPLGLILLAFDLPILRPSVNAALIRARRKWATWRRKGRRDISG